MRVFLTGAALSLLLAGAAVAQGAGDGAGMMPPPPPPGGMEGHPPMMGPLKRADVPAMVAKHFAMLDLNKDGVFDDADRVAMVAKRRADREAEVKADRDRMFAALDANKDGSISREEFDAPPPRFGGRGPEGRGRPDGPEGRDVPGGPGGPDHTRGPGRGPGPDGPGHDGPGAGPGRMGGMGMRGHGGPGFGMMGGRMLEKADANHDGKVTLAEAQKAALAAFDKADVNHDGMIDRDEMIVAMQHRMHGDGPDGDRRHGPEGK